MGWGEAGRPQRDVEGWEQLLLILWRHRKDGTVLADLDPETRAVLVRAGATD